MKRTLSLLLAVVLLFVTLAGCGNGKKEKDDSVTVTTPLNFVKKTAKVKNPIRNAYIKVIRQGKIIAEGYDEVETERLQPNDIIEVEADYCFVKVNFFPELGEAILYSPSGEFLFQIPDPASFNSNNPSPYAPNAFTNNSNTLKADVATDAEIKASRNLALNPYDFMYKSEINDFAAAQNTLPGQSAAVEAGEVLVYPHAYGNRVTDGKATFWARNAIDGMTDTGNGHYGYPKQSWGCGKNADAQFVLYFGRQVEVSSLVFTLRADFTGTPAHDTYWEQITAQFEDGTEQLLYFERGGQAQTKTLSSPQKTSYIVLKDFVVYEDASTAGWAALTEIQVNGRDIQGNPVATKTTVKNTFGGKQVINTTSELRAEDIKNKIDAAFDYAITMKKDIYGNDIEIKGLDWKVGAFYVGLVETYTTTGNVDHYLFLRNIAEQFNYTIKSTRNGQNGREFNYGRKISATGLRPGYTGNGDVSDFADDYLIGEAYLFMNELKPNANKTFNAVVNAEANLENKPSWCATFNEGATNKNTNTFNWWWCDALYMGLNTYTLMSNLTGDSSYIEKAHRSYTYWREKLLNTQYNLWHRDLSLINNKTTSGKPEFWARGNAWVFAALAKQMLYIDETRYPEIYNDYKDDFIDMAESLKTYQRGDGTWNASIIDPSFYGGPETTGTCGFLYGFAIGVQLGILDYHEYYPVIKKIWEAINDTCTIDPNEPGRIGYMQWVGYQPQNYQSDTYTRPLSNPFGYGLFFMGASALMRMCADYQAPELIVPNDPQSGFIKLPTE